MNQRPGNAWAHCVEKAATRYVVQYEDATWTSSDRGFSITIAGCLRVGHMHIFLFKLNPIFFRGRQR
jgi:hypothetical protein